jgi:hypothetical protein
MKLNRPTSTAMIETIFALFTQFPGEAFSLDSIATSTLDLLTSVIFLRRGFFRTRKQGHIISINSDIMFGLLKKG